MKSSSSRAARQLGQSMVEYLVISAVLALALFTPVPGSQETAAQMLANRLRDFYSALSLFLSLP